MTTAYQPYSGNYANSSKLFWKSEMERNKIVYLQGKNNHHLISRILSGKTKLKRYSDKNHSTFLYAAMEFFTLNRIFARRVNGNNFSDLVVIRNGQKLFIRLNPLNARLDIEQLTTNKNNPEIFIANDMVHLTDYFKNIINKPKFKEHLKNKQCH